MLAKHKMTFFVRQEGDGPDQGRVVSVHAEDRATALDQLIDDHGAIAYHDVAQEA